MREPADEDGAGNRRVVVDADDGKIEVEVEVEKKCEKCGEDCNCEVKVEVPTDGAAGSKDGKEAILGCDTNSASEMLADSMVESVKAQMRANARANGQRDFDPLNFFREPIRVDMYEPITRTGNQPLK